MKISLNYLEAAAVAVAIYYTGVWLKNRSKLIRDFYIPEAVAGGLLFAFLKFVLYKTGICEIAFDGILQQFFMTLFFTSVGFAAKFNFVRKGGNKLFILGVLCFGLIVLQNVISIAVAKLMGHLPLLGLASGSMPLVGGHGSAGVFGPVLENMGAVGAVASSMSMATFGLIMGGIIGGPVAGMLIKKYNLKGTNIETAMQECEVDLENTNVDSNTTRDSFRLSAAPDIFMRALGLLLFAMGLGSIVSDIGKGFGLFLPPYLGSIIVAAVLRNIESNDLKSIRYIPLKEIVLLAELSLNIFLAMALMSLNMWELAALAGPLAISALAQMLFMSLYTYFVVFRALGSNYEAAVTVAAVCGFGLGAVPTAMANMQSIAVRFGPAPSAFLMVPIIGSVADGINAAVIIFFINLLG